MSRSKPQETGITLIPNETNLFVWRALLKVGCCSLPSRPYSGLQQQHSDSTLGPRLETHR